MEEERGIEKAAEESMLFENLPQLPEGFNLDQIVGSDVCDALLGAIPILKYLKVGKDVYVSITDKLFAKKFIGFLYGLKEIPVRKREKFINELRKSGEATGELILSIIDRLNHRSKTAILANLCIARIEEQISIEDFFRLVSMLERIPYVDLNRLEDYKEKFYEPGASEMLYTAGAVRQVVMDAVGDNLYQLTELGLRMLCFGLQRNVSGINLQTGTDIHQRRIEA